MTYCFYAKKDIDYTKYGFVDEGTELIILRDVRRITIRKKDYSMSFNCITTEILKIFMDMIKDDVVFVKNFKAKPKRNHYMGLTDEEYEIIKKMRNEENE